MKQKIRLAAMLWPILTIMCLEAVQQVFAQGAEPAATAIQMDSIKPLQIGDTIPEYLWHLPLQVVNHPEGKKTSTLNDYKGKLIILDFWATWCSACIKQFPKMEELQQRFERDLQIIPITAQSKQVVSDFQKKSERYTDQFSVVGQKAMAAVFPYRILPHYIWIAKSGVVQAATDPEPVNADNIAKVNNSGQGDWVMKYDVDTKKPLFLDGSLGNSQLSRYSILIKGYYPGLGSGGNKGRTGNTVRIGATNYPVFELYGVAMMKLFEDRGQKFSIARTIFDKELGDVSQLIIGMRDTLSPDRLFTYDLWLPAEQEDSLYSVMLFDLNRSSGYRGYIEEREVDCLVVSDQMPTDDDGTGVPATDAHRSLWYLVSRWNNVKEPGRLPLIDESGYRGPIDVSREIVGDIHNLSMALKKHNLTVKHATRKLDMFILEKNHTDLNHE